MLEDLITVKLKQSHLLGKMLFIIPKWAASLTRDVIRKKAIRISSLRHIVRDHLRPNDLTKRGGSVPGMG